MGEDTLSGRVLLPDGRPAAGAVVRLFYCHDLSGYGSRWLSEAKADEKGAFEIIRPAFKAPVIALTPPVVSRCYLVAQLDGFAAGITEVGKADAETYTLSLENGRALICEVVSGDVPVADAEVCAYPELNRLEGIQALQPDSSPGVWGLMAVAREIYRGKTGADGRVTLNDLPVVSLQVLAWHPEKG